MQVSGGSLRNQKRNWEESLRQQGSSLRKEWNKAKIRDLMHATYTEADCDKVQGKTKPGDWYLEQYAIFVDHSEGHSPFIMPLTVYDIEEILEIMDEPGFSMDGFMDGVQPGDIRSLRSNLEEALFDVKSRTARGVKFGHIQLPIDHPSRDKIMEMASAR